MVDASCDTRDLDQTREQSYTYVKFTGDAKTAIERRIAVSETSFDDLLNTIQEAFDRRLTLGFVDPDNSKTLELTQKSFRKRYLGVDPDERMIIARPMYPGISLRESTTMTAPHATTAADSPSSPSPSSSSRPRSAAARPSSSASQRTTGDESSPHNHHRSLTPADEHALVSRLYKTSPLAKAKKAIVLAEKYYPTEDQPKKVYHKEEELSSILERLTHDPLRRRRDDVERRRVKLVADGVIVDKTNVRRCEDREEEEEHARRFYNGGIEHETKKRDKLERKHLVERKSRKQRMEERGELPRPVLRTPEQWQEWEQKMKRDIKQNFRLRDRELC